MNNTRLNKLLAKDAKRTLAETNELVSLLVTSVTELGKAILDMRAVSVKHKEAIELLTGIVAPPEEDNPFKLIGITPPKLELN